MTPSPHNRRRFLSSGAAALAAGFAVSPAARAEEEKKETAAIPVEVTPPVMRQVMLSCKLGMIADKDGDRALTLAERLKTAKDAGFDGVDFDEAGSFTPEQAREAVRESGMFVHNAINHAHWSVRLTDPAADVRAKALANLEHTIRVSHAAGGSGVLLVIGKADDGPEEEVEERCRVEMKKAIPLAAALGQRILVENVWNRMMYDHEKPPEQTPDRFIKFVDSFRSPWVGMYFDLGNHWKYGQPGDWLRAFGPRAVKLDVKGFNRPKSEFVDITSEADDMPWKDIQKAISDTGFHGWTTAEVGGGGVKHLTKVREQMQKAFGL